MPLPFKHYQNTSECSTANEQFNPGELLLLLLLLFFSLTLFSLLLYLILVLSSLLLAKLLLLFFSLCKYISSQLKCVCSNSAALKGNSNYQGILSWIIQIFHYYCKKQYKNIENSRIIEQNLVLSLRFSLFTVACAYCRLPQRQNFKRHK